MAIPRQTFVPISNADKPCEASTHYCMAVDSSRSIFRPEVQGLWDQLKEAIEAIVRSLTTDSKVALVKYAAYQEDMGNKQVEREITFADNTNKRSVIQAIRDMQPIKFQDGIGNGGTATPEAINECLDIFQKESPANVSKVILVFTDGVTHYFKYRQTPEVARQRLKAAVDRASAAGVINYGVVFIGNDNVEEAMFEALEIAQQVRDRAFYGGSLEEVQEDVLASFNCGKCKADSWNSIYKSMHTSLHIVNFHFMPFHCQYTVYNCNKHSVVQYSPVGRYFSLVALSPCMIH